MNILQKLYRMGHNTPETTIKGYDMAEEYVTSQEAAKIADVSPSRIRQLLLKGRLKGRHFGRDWQVELASLRDFASKPRKTGRPRIDKVSR